MGAASTDEGLVRDFAAASSVERSGEGRFRSRVPDGWQQGRGAFGGLVIGIAVRAMEADEPRWPLRALTAELPAPLLAGEAAVELRLLRRGRGLSALEATIVQEGEAKARVSGVFGRSRAEALRFAPAPPRPGGWASVEPLPSGSMPPPFARFFEYRLTGPAPFSGHAEPVAEGWVRPAAPLERFGAAEVAAMADAYWPSVFSCDEGPRPMATVTYSLQLTAKAYDLDPSAPLYYRARALAADAGYVAELRELWTADGELVALNPQTFVVIK